MSQESSPEKNPGKLEKTENVIDKVFSKKRFREKYCKLNKEKNEFLENFFKNTTKYPSKEEYETIALKLSEVVAKIENWFKHKRRKTMIENKPNSYKKRNQLKESETAILEETFRDTMHPNKAKLNELSQTLKLKRKIISNWFSYRRKKFSILNNDFRERNNSSENQKPNKIEKENKISSLESKDLSLQLNQKNESSYFPKPNESTECPKKLKKTNKSEEKNQCQKIKFEKEPKKINSQELQNNTNQIKSNDSSDTLINCKNYYQQSNNIIQPQLAQACQITERPYSFNQNNIQNFYQNYNNQQTQPNFSNDMRRNYVPQIFLGQNYMIDPISQQQYVFLTYPTNSQPLFFPNYTANDRFICNQPQRPDLYLTNYGRNFNKNNRDISKMDK